MGEKEEGTIRKYFLHKATDDHDEFLKSLLLGNETILFHCDTIFFTNKRIIKTHIGWWSKIFHYFYSTFEDLDYQFLESVKAKNVINLKLFIAGCIVLLLGPIAAILEAIPGISAIGLFITKYVVNSLQIEGIILIGIILIGASLLLRDRFIEFHGSNSVLRASHFSDEELKKIRELQYIGQKKKS